MNIDNSSPSIRIEPDLSRLIILDCGDHIRAVKASWITGIWHEKNDAEVVVHYIGIESASEIVDAALMFHSAAEARLEALKLVSAVNVALKE